MKTVKIIIPALLLIFGIQSFAQDNLSPERKQAIDSLALEKVRDFSKYISLIGDKSTDFSEANRVIERAIELFMEGSEVGVSSLYKEAISYYPVRDYLELKLFESKH